ncbi:histidine kinase [candidate division KSB1 bacterium]|nr:histidine kinase [candidate division KSB1 bacterium]
MMHFEKIRKHVSPFWALQIGGWLSIWLMYIAMHSVKEPISPNNILGLFITYLTGFLITIPLRYYNRRLGYQGRSVQFIAMNMLVSSLVLSLIWFWIDIFASIPLHGMPILEMNLHWIKFIWSWSSYLMVIIIWSSLYFVIKFYREWNEQKVRTEQANRMAQSAQLQMLRYQLNPHFLFNSLNSIRALIDEDKDHARQMITELSEFLRYSLISKNFKDVPLSEELDAIRHYFEIEKIRYEDKLEVAFEIDPLAEEYPVLSFLIHPLVENAIKYGMKTSDMPLKIRIKARVVEDTLQVEVCNTGKWVEPQQHEDDEMSTNTGLDNIRQRLDNAFPNQYSLIVEQPEGSVHIKLEIRKKIDA